MALPYSKQVIQHFNKPHNYGKMKNPDGVGEVGNVVCGDLMKLYIKVGQNKKGQDIIKDIKFETYGCLAAIASSSMLTDLVKGKTIEEAIKFDRKEIVEGLGSLPPIKIHCSVLAGGALIEAIHDYLTKNKKPIPQALNKRHKQLAAEKQTIGKNRQVC
ncbi:MAG: iron-sulfur cluster assembly scaffold protein [Candidatus Pacebacteria bacterium]|nr:iron-sulfur cluster assembly scaffold protein [Candidatus Paceibacterota bacterium]